MSSRRVRIPLAALLLAATSAAGASAAWAQGDPSASGPDAPDANAPVMLVTPTPPSVAVPPSGAWPLAKPSAPTPPPAAADSAAPVAPVAAAPASAAPASAAAASPAPTGDTPAAAEPADAPADAADAQDAAPAAPIDLSLPSPQITPAPKRIAAGAVPPAPAPPAGKPAARPADPRLRVQASVGFNAGYLTSPVAVSADLVGGQSSTKLPVPHVTDSTPTPLLPDQRVPDREVAIGMSYTLHQNGRTRVSLDGSVGVVTYGADPDRPADLPYKPVGTTSIRVSF